MSQTLFDLVVEDDLKAVEEELEGYKEQARDAGTSTTQESLLYITVIAFIAD